MPQCSIVPRVSDTTHALSGASTNAFVRTHTHISLICEAWEAKLSGFGFGFMRCKAGQRRETSRELYLRVRPPGRPHLCLAHWWDALWHGFANSLCCLYFDLLQQYIATVVSVVGSQVIVVVNNHLHLRLQGSREGGVVRAVTSSFPKNVFFFVGVYTKLSRSVLRQS